MRFVAQIDGASRKNPGPAAIGVVIKDDEGVDLLTRGEYIGETTNNVAEYRALLAALDFLITLCQGKFGRDPSEHAYPEVEVKICCDSELVVYQLKGNYRVKNAALVPLFEEALRKMRVFGKVDLTKIPREENRLADKLANKAINVKGRVEEI